MQEFTLINTAALSCNTLYRTFQGRILISKPGRRYKQQVTQALKDQRQAKQYQGQQWTDFHLPNHVRAQRTAS